MTPDWAMRLPPNSSTGASPISFTYLRYSRDLVSVLHQRERAAGGGLGTDVQDHGAVRSAAHARIGDAHHVGDALLQELGRQRHVADFGHAGIALRPAVLQHHDALLGDVEI